MFPKKTLKILASLKILVSASRHKATGQDLVKLRPITTSQQAFINAVKSKKKKKKKRGEATRRPLCDARLRRSYQPSQQKCDIRNQDDHQGIMAEKRKHASCAKKTKTNTLTRETAVKDIKIDGEKVEK